MRVFTRNKKKGPLETTPSVAPWPPASGPAAAASAAATAAAAAVFTQGSSSAHRPLCPIHNQAVPEMLATTDGEVLEPWLERGSFEFGRISIANSSTVTRQPPLRKPSSPSPSPLDEAGAATAPLRVLMSTTTSFSSPTSIPSRSATSTAEAEAVAAVAAAAVAAGLVDERGRCVPCRRKRLAARRYRWKLIAGLIFPFALQALDVTIIASALPWIATDFGEVSQLNWIISAFNLTSAAFIPFWGQAADIFGRHAAIQVALLIMMAGSALCTAAPTSTFSVLLLGRAVQGAGCAGLNVVVRVILLDRVSLRENAKNWSIFSFTAGMSYGVGPVVGGALTNVNWRWCFAVNLPICVAAMGLIAVVLRRELLGPQSPRRPPPLPAPESAAGCFEPPSVRLGPRRGPSCSRPAPPRTPLAARLASVDVGGQLLFLFGLGLLILALTWAGATYDWATAAVLVPLCAGLVLIAAFVGYEHFMAPGRPLARRWPDQKPMLPWTLLDSKDIGLLFYINFASGAAMYSVLYFCNLYFTMVKLYGPAYAGMQLLYYTPGLGVGVYLSMYFLNAWPRNTVVPLILGSVVEAAGVGILAWALRSGQLPAIFGMMALTGAGTGLRLMPASLHAVGFFPQHVAAVVSLMAVALPLGGTLALTVMATVFNNASGIVSSSPLRNVKTLDQLPPDALAGVVDKARMGIVWAYVAIAPFMITCMVAALLLGNVQIAKAATKKTSTDAVPVLGDDGEHHGESDGRNVVGGVYLLAVLRGRKAPPQEEEESQSPLERRRHQNAPRPQSTVPDRPPRPCEKTIQAFVEP